MVRVKVSVKVRVRVRVRVKVRVRVRVRSDPHLAFCRCSSHFAILAHVKVFSSRFSVLICVLPF